MQKANIRAAPPAGKINFSYVKRAVTGVCDKMANCLCELQLYAFSARGKEQLCFAILLVCEGIVLLRLISMFPRKFITKVALVSIALRRLESPPSRFTRSNGMLLFPEDVTPLSCILHFHIDY